MLPVQLVVLPTMGAAAAAVTSRRNLCLRMAPAGTIPCQRAFIPRRSSVAIARELQLYPFFVMLAAGVWTTEPADDHDTASHGFQLIVTEHARSQVRFRRKALDLAHGLLSLIVWLLFLRHTLSVGRPCIRFTGAMASGRVAVAPGATSGA